MDFAEVHPPLPSVSRWVRLCRKFPGASTLRKLQYEHLETLELHGKLLDVGGGRKAHYLKHLSTGIEYDSINIDPKIDPTWLVGVGETFPVEDHTFDCCLSMNTLEHVYDPRFLIQEMYRVVKPGGQLHITVPWMFRIHAHPDDFLRMTPSWWNKSLGDAGFRETTITPMVWGRNSTGALISGRKGIRTHMAHVTDSLYAACALRGFDRAMKRRQRIYNVALGHFISARK